MWKAGFKKFEVIWSAQISFDEKKKKSLAQMFPTCRSNINQHFNDIGATCCIHFRKIITVSCFQQRL